MTPPDRTTAHVEPLGNQFCMARRLSQCIVARIALSVVEPVFQATFIHGVHHLFHELHIRRIASEFIIVAAVDDGAAAAVVLEGIGKDSGTPPTKGIHSWTCPPMQCFSYVCNRHPIA